MKPSENSLTLTRKSFLGLGAAFCLSRAQAVEGVKKKKANLRVGLLADIHFDLAKDTSVHFETALRDFDRRKCDAVLICGDLAQNGVEQQLLQVGETWRKVFPGNRRSDGAPIVKLFHYGDHDTGGYAHTKEFFQSGERLMKAYGCSYDEVVASCIRNHRAETWKKAFDEDFAPIIHKTVKGYDFILANFTSGEPGNRGGNNTPGLEDFLKTAKLDPAKPFFFSQHRAFRGTIGEKDIGGQDDGRSTQALSAFPNCLAFCGHLHRNFNDEKMIWQGGFTAIHVPTLRDVYAEPDRENTVPPKARAAQDTRVREMRSILQTPSWQCGVMEVFDDRIVVERRVADTGAELAPAWVIPLEETVRPYTPENRLAVAVRPAFPVDARVTVVTRKGRNRARREHDQVVVTFPPARATATTPRAYDYLVTAEVREKGVWKPLLARAVFSPGCYRPDAEETVPVTCVFAAAELGPASKGELRFSVVPRDSFGRAGKALQS